MAKLEVGAADDPYEREADRVADQIVDAPSPSPKCSNCEDEDRGSVSPTVSPVIQRACASCEDEHLLQRTPESVCAIEADTPEAVRALGSGGRRLSESERAFFEPRFDADFSGVRVHEGPRADTAARSVHAKAYTLGSDVVFRSGAYAGSDRGSRRLLAHELTHVIQQRGSTHARVQRDGELPEGVLFDSDAIERAATSVVDALEGWTSGADQARIRQALTSHGTQPTRSIYRAIRSKGSDHGQTSDGMVEWIRSDVTTDDWHAIRNYAFEHQAMDHVERFAAREVAWEIGSFTWESSAHEVQTILGKFNGSALDAVLTQLERQRRADMHATVAWLFGQTWDPLTGVDRVTARRLAEQLAGAGSTRGLRYAAGYHAGAVTSLLEGATGTADSAAILRHFQAIGSDIGRALMIQRLDAVAPDNQAQAWLMSDMHADDYAALRLLGGLSLAARTEAPGFWEQAGNGLDYTLRVAQVIACFNAGVLITGPLSVVWDLVVMVWDLLVAVYHIFGLIIYAITGSDGRGSMQAFERFWNGLVQMFGEPGTSFEAWWRGVADGFDTIEGPLSDCRRAEYVARRITNAVINLILVFVGGYGVAKGVASGVKGGMTLAGAVRAGRGLEVATEMAGAAGRTARAGALAVARGPAALAQAVRAGLMGLGRIRQTLSTVLVAAQDFDMWAAVNRAGAGIQRATAAERAFWTEQRSFWQTRAWQHQAQHDALLARLRATGQAAETTAAAGVADEAGGVSDDVGAVDDLETRTSQLHEEVAGRREPGSARPPDPVDELGPINGETRELLDRDRPLRDSLIDNPRAARALKRCSSPCYPSSATPAQVDRLDGLLGEMQAHGITWDEEALTTFLRGYADRGQLDDAIAILEDRFAPYRARGSTGAQVDQDVAVQGEAPRREPHELGERGVADEPAIIRPHTRGQLDALPGSAHGGENLPDITGRWFSEAEPTMPPHSAAVWQNGRAPIPGQIARRMRGMEFRNWAHFRETFWRLVAEDPHLSQGWTQGTAHMASGGAPHAGAQAIGGGSNARFQLNHIEPLSGFTTEQEAVRAMYDLGNLEVVGPFFHQQVGL